MLSRTLSIQEIYSTCRKISTSPPRHVALLMVTSAMSSHLTQKWPSSWRNYLLFLNKKLYYLLKILLLRPLLIQLSNPHFDTIQRKLAHRDHARCWMLPNSAWHGVTRREFVTLNVNVTINSFDSGGPGSIPGQSAWDLWWTKWQ
jgi:hypothetical protein